MGWKRAPRKRENARVGVSRHERFVYQQVGGFAGIVSVFIGWAPALKTRIQHSWLFSVVVGCFIDPIETHHRLSLDAIVDGPRRCFFNLSSVTSPRLMLRKAASVVD